MVAVLNDQNKKVEESTLNHGDKESGKRRITADNTDLHCVLQELLRNANLLLKTKVALVASLGEMKSIADIEAKERVGLLGKFRNLEHECDGLKANIAEESGGYENVCCLLSKALGDADINKQKYEIDEIEKAEELELARLKLQA